MTSGLVVGDWSRPDDRYGSVTLVDRPVVRSVGLFVGWSVGRSAGRSVGQSVGRSGLGRVYGRAGERASGYHIALS